MTRAKDMLNGHTWLFAAAIAGALALGTGYWAINRTVFTFGPPPAAHLSPDVVHAGDPVQACFDSIYWYRPMPGFERHYFECMKKDADGKLTMTRFDMVGRRINNPSRPGPLPPKCRWVGSDSTEKLAVPSWCEPGPLHYGGYITFETLGGWWPLYYDLPARMDAEIQP